MVFSSTIFLFLFLPITLLLYFNPFFKSRQYRNIVLLLTSLLFYAWGEPVFVFVMIGFIVFDWFMALIIDKCNNMYDKMNHRKKGYIIKKICLIFTIVIHLLLFFVYKYLVFVCENVNELFQRKIFSVSIALPIGISFFLFQMLSYVLDVYWGKAKVQKNLLNVALYVSMFPQLVAGPIVRYTTVSEEIIGRKETRADFSEGIIRFIYGLAKKILLANYFGILTDNIFILYEEQTISVALAWMGAITYTLQIYFDFSAYSDMAIGLGRVFGFHFDENFKYPYIAASVTEFWKRWHISLSSWFRDYVYIPLGGNRVAPKRHIFNLFVVWLLTGIWHGANWTFIVWGLVYFIFLVLEKRTGFVLKLGRLSHIYTMLVVILAWVLFRADSITQAIGYIGTMFGIHADGAFGNIFWEYLSQGKWIIIGGIIGATPYYKEIFRKFIKNSVLYEFMKASILVVLLVITIFNMVKSTYNPFIYFNF